jgi:acyl carrier protein
MMSKTEEVVRRHVAKVARISGPAADQLNMDSPLRQEYAISSMKMVMLMTALCNELGVSLNTFDERNLARIQTGRDLVRMFDEAKGEAAA